MLSVGFSPPFPEPFSPFRSTNVQRPSLRFRLLLKRPKISFLACSSLPLSWNLGFPSFPRAFVRCRSDHLGDPAARVFPRKFRAPLGFTFRSDSPTPFRYRRDSFSAISLVESYHLIYRGLVPFSEYLTFSPPPRRGVTPPPRSFFPTLLRLAIPS